MYVNQLMCTCTIFCHMGKMSDGPVKVGENDCWAQCHMGTMSRFGVIWAQFHLALPIWHPQMQCKPRANMFRYLKREKFKVENLLLFCFKFQAGED